MILEVYSAVTKKILDELDKGVVPWIKPWNELQSCNMVSGRAYTGINRWLLSSCTHWATFNQIKELGGKLKAGSKSSIAVFWKPYEDSNGEQRLVCRYYHLFNINQVEGIPPEKLPKIDMAVPEPDAEKIWLNYKDCPTIEYGSNQAGYFPDLDILRMPVPASFNSVNAFYLTLFHELIHSTGHKDRLDRKASLDPNSDKYQTEELIAEIGACYLASYTGIQNDIEQSAAYIDHWKNLLSGDKHLIMTASAKAQKAVDYILGVQPV